MSRNSEVDRTCLDLALEGERLCKIGDCKKGVECLETALQVGTDDLILLSAIYSQLGNGYFYLQKYDKALEYHQYDLTLASSHENKISKAKAYGNLGNTLKIMGRFDEAISCCKQHLKISQEVKDRIGEARALYNLGNVYLSKAKKVGLHNNAEPGRYSEFAETTLNQAVEQYRKNVKILLELGDNAALGRTYGNLGSAYYLLGDFENALHYHQQRLDIAKEFGDRTAERRAHSNLGNACVLSGDYKMASEHYKLALNLSKQLEDKVLEEEVCYSLANVSALLNDHDQAIEYHLLHLQIAKDLNDAVGLSRSYWSLGNEYSETGDTKKALHFLKLHLDISTKLGDTTGQEAALRKLKCLDKNFGKESSGLVVTDRSVSVEAEIFKEPDGDTVDVGYTRRYRRQHVSQSTSSTTIQGSSTSTVIENEDESFFELLNCMQSRRLNDQRCSYKILKNSLAKHQSQSQSSCIVQNELDLKAEKDTGNDIQKSGGPSLAESRLPGLTNVSGCHDSSSQDSSSASDKHFLPEDKFFSILQRSQSLRYEDQRSSLSAMSASTEDYPEDDIFGLIQRLQSDRINDQRWSLPRSSNVNETSGFNPPKASKNTSKEKLSSKKVK